MSQLSAKNLPPDVRAFTYDRGEVTSGIVHFGIGNFHRAHQAVYCDDLLNDGDTQWGITGVSLRSASMQEALEPQDYLYTLAMLGETTEYRIIGAIKDVVVAPREPQAVIDLIAKDTTHVISSTITEKGYCLSSGKVDFEHPALQAELISLGNPSAIYGFLACGIIKRSQKTSPSPKLTIMCCDNISAGGELLRDGVRQLLERHDKKALAWSDEHVGFISSMVDRVCPATDDALRDRVFHDTKKQDAWPVSAEPFTQWIIEGDFAGKRPEFDRVGAVFVDDIAPFEQMKLRYLNAAHTMVSTLGYLTGDVFVHQSIERPEIINFTRKALYENVLPNAAVPQGYDGKVYIKDVITRFQNGNLPYANLQVGTDSSQKIQQRWFPTIDTAVTQNADCSYFEFCLGAWVIFIQTALKNDVLNDPMKEMLAQIETNDLGEMIMFFLKIAGVEKFEFFQNSNFMMAVNEHARTIQTNGITSALSEFLNSREQIETKNA